MNFRARERRQVLIVDDERRMLDLLADVVERMGCCPLKARNVPRAVSLLERNAVDIMLLDLAMPGANGIDLLKAMHKRRVPIATVVVSAFISPPVLKQLVALDVQGVVTKPFRVSRLTHEIRKALIKLAGGVARCPACNSELDQKHRFCGECGQKQTVEDQERGNGRASREPLGVSSRPVASPM